MSDQVKQPKKRRWVIWLSALVVLVLGGWTVGSYAAIWSVEEAPYTVEKIYAGFEVRAYPKLMLAETITGTPGSNADNEAFRKLARYIFGGNAEGRDIAMTAPVMIDDTSGKTKMSFVLPATITAGGAPAPKQDDVAVRERAPLRVAALRFSWFASRDRRQALGDDLLAKLKAESLTPAGPPIYAAYNPPMTIPFARRNEMLVPLKD